VPPRRAAIARFDALGLAAGLWFLTLFVRYVFPPLFPAFRDAHGLSPAALGLLFSLLMGSYAATQLPAGLLSDRRGRVLVIAGGALLAAVGALLVALWRSPTGLATGMVLIGVGSGVHKTVAIPLLATIYRRTPGRTLGLMDAAGQAGGLAAPAVAVVAGPRWPVIFVASAAIGVLLAVGVHRSVPQRLAQAVPASGPESAGDRTGPDGSGPTDSAGLRAALAPLRDPRLAAFVGVTGLVAIGWNGLSAFLPLYLVDVRGASTGTAGLVYGGLFAIGLLQPLAGSAGDRLGHLVAGLGGAALAAVGIAAVVLLPAGLVPGGVLLAGAGLHGFRPVRDAWLVDRLPSSAAGGSLGAVRTITMGAGAAAPGAVGALVAAAGYPAGLGALAGALVLAALVLVVLLVTGDATDIPALS
jgi:MFS family permease